MPRNTITAAVFPLLLLLLSIASSAYGFTAAPNNGVSMMMMTTTTRHAASSSSSAGGDPNEIIARKIIVCGDVDGGYYRSCVKNEVRFLDCMYIFCAEKISEIYLCIFLSDNTCFCLFLFNI